MNGRTDRAALAAIIPLLAVAACGGPGGQKNLQYPYIRPQDLSVESVSCGGLDHYIRQVDSIRWSMREDGFELNTDFNQMVRFTAATAAAIAIAVPLITIGIPDPTMLALPYAAAHTDSDSLKQTDALLIALLVKREELECPPDPDCAIESGPSGTLAKLRVVRVQVESREIEETRGLHDLTALLDQLCPVGNRFI